MPRDEYGAMVAGTTLPVTHRRTGVELNTQAGIANAAAKIEIFEMKEVAFVESADVIEKIAADREARAGNRIDRYGVSW